MLSKTSRFIIACPVLVSVASLQFVPSQANAQHQHGGRKDQGAIHATKSHHRLSVFAPNSGSSSSSKDSGDEPPLNEDGYQKVASLVNDAAMKAFIYRLLEANSKSVENEGDLSGLVPHYSGTSNVQTFEHLKDELWSVSWIVDKPMNTRQPIENLEHSSEKTKANRALGVNTRVDEQLRAQHPSQHLSKQTSESFAKPSKKLSPRRKKTKRVSSRAVESENNTINDLFEDMLVRQLDYATAQWEKPVQRRSEQQSGSANDSQKGSGNGTQKNGKTAHTHKRVLHKKVKRRPNESQPHKLAKMHAVHAPKNAEKRNFTNQTGIFKLGASAVIGPQTTGWFRNIVDDVMDVYLEAEERIEGESVRKRLPMQQSEALPKQQGEQKENCTANTSKNAGGNIGLNSFKGSEKLGSELEKYLKNTTAGLKTMVQTWMQRLR